MKIKKYMIITTEDFLKLYKNRYVYISSSLGVERREEIEKLFNKIQLNDENEYLIIEANFRKEKFGIKEIYVRLDIVEVKNIYALSKESQNFFRTRLNSNLKIDLWKFKTKDSLKEIKKNHKKKNSKDGALFLLESIKDFESIEYREARENIENNEYLNDIENYPETCKTYEEFAFFYKRENKLKKIEKSFLLDTIIIKSLKKHINTDRSPVKIYKIGRFPLERSPIFLDIENMSNKEKFYELVESFIELNTETTKEFLKEFGQEEFLLTILILKLKSVLLDEELSEEEKAKMILEIISDFSKEYKKELYQAIIIIGSRFGYLNLYNIIYLIEEIDLYKENEKIELEENLSELNKQIKSYEDEISQLKEKKQEQEIEKKRLEESLNNLEQENKKNESKLARLKGENIKQETYKMKLEEGLNDLEQENEKNEFEIDRLKETIELVNEETGELKEKKFDLETKINDLNQLTKTYEDEISKLEESIKMVNKKTVELKEKKINLETNVSDLNQLTKTYEGEVSRLKESLDIVYRNNKKLENEIDKLDIVIKEKKKTIHSSKQKIKRRENKIKELDEDSKE